MKRTLPSAGIFLIAAIIIGILAAFYKHNNAWLQNYQYPYPVHYYKTTVDEHPIKIAYMQIKPEQKNAWNGKTVVLFHGKNFPSAYWKDTIEQLNQAGYQVIAIDQLGSGKSSKPIALYYTFQLLANVSHHLIESLGIKKISIIGHSMGGMLAERLALMYPDMTEKLILEDPLGLEDYREGIPYMSVSDQYKELSEQTKDNIQQSQMNLYYHWDNKYQTWADLQASIKTAGDQKRIEWVSALLYQMIYTQPTVYELYRLKMPVLLIIGKNGTVAPGKEHASKEAQKKLGDIYALAQDTRKEIPVVKVVTIPNTGHVPHLESFDDFIKPVLAFLKK